MSQDALPGIDGLHGARDPLGRCYTPMPLAAALVGTLRGTGDAVERVVEPSVGGGSFAREIRTAWPHAQLVGVDVDPSAAGLALVDDAVVADWPAYAARIREPSFDLAIGNPPFGKLVSNAVTIAHVMACRAVARRTALILPLAVLGVDAWEETLATELVRVWRILPRPWGDKVREVAMFEWERGWRHSPDLGLVRWRRG